MRWEDGDKRRTMTNKLTMESKYHTDDRGLAQALLRTKWITGPAPEDLLWSQPHKTVAFPFPSLKPPVNTALLQKYIEWACKAEASAQIWAEAFPPWLSASGTEGGHVPPCVAMDGTETWRQHLEEHRYIPEILPGCWCLWRPFWASVTKKQARTTSTNQAKFEEV